MSPDLSGPASWERAYAPGHRATRMQVSVVRDVTKNRAGIMSRVQYDPTIYQGAAAYYRYGRPAYSPQLETVLTAELDLDGTGRLLDGGCGPGILTVRLAHLFNDVVAARPRSSHAG